MLPSRIGCPFGLGLLAALPFLGASPAAAAPQLTHRSPQTYVAPKIRYVDPDAPGPQLGDSWRNAYANLSFALSLVPPGYEIRVAEGTYFPDYGSGDRTKRFVIPPDVEVRGGFAGFGHPNPNARDFALYPSVLSGDLAGDDLPGFLNRADNSYRLVRANCTFPQVSVLDGFTIRGMNNDTGTGGDGGIHLRHAVLRGCLVTDCLTNSVGIIDMSDAGLVEDCEIAGNRSLGWGGALRAGSGTILRSTFFDNTTDQVNGGAAICAEFGDLAIDGCSFRENVIHGSSFNFGGAVSLRDGNCTVRNCLFDRNAVLDSDYGEGGGLYAEMEGGSLAIANCTFVGNAVTSTTGATSIGGGLVAYGQVTVQGCSFTGNKVSALTFAHGGGALVWAGGGYDLLVTGCSFSENTSNLVGGIAGLFDYINPGDTGTVRVANSVLFGNSDGIGQAETAQIGGLPGYTALVLSHSCVQNLSVYAVWPGMIGGDPLFLDPRGPDGIAGTPDDDLRLGAGSPCIDAASNLLIQPDWTDIDGDGDFAEQMPLDRDGNPRRVDDPTVTDTGDGTAPIVDMGAYEHG